MTLQTRKPPRVTAIRIVRADNGGQIRTIVEHNHARPTGMIPSLKAGIQMNWDDVREQQFLWIAEVDHRVTHVLAQPFRIDIWLSDGTTMSYFPDFEWIFENNREVIEIKKTAAEINRDPRYKLKIGIARNVCKAKGWKFHVVTPAHKLLSPTLIENARRIRIDRFTRLATEDHLRIAEAMNVNNGKLSYGEAVAALSRCNDPWDPTGVAKLHAMIARRHVRVDLTRKLTQSTMIVLSENTTWQPDTAS